MSRAKRRWVPIPMPAAVLPALLGRRRAPLRYLGSPRSPLSHIPATIDVLAMINFIGISCPVSMTLGVQPLDRSRAPFNAHYTLAVDVRIPLRLIAAFYACASPIAPATYRPQSASGGSAGTPLEESSGQAAASRFSGSCSLPPEQGSQAGDRPAPAARHWRKRPALVQRGP